VLGAEEMASGICAKGVSTDGRSFAGDLDTQWRRDYPERTSTKTWSTAVSRAVEKPVA
jgi:hypothetical protein